MNTRISLFIQPPKKIHIPHWKTFGETSEMRVFFDENPRRVLKKYFCLKF